MFPVAGFWNCQVSSVMAFYLLARLRQPEALITFLLQKLFLHWAKPKWVSLIPLWFTSSNFKNINSGSGYKLSNEICKSSTAMNLSRFIWIIIFQRSLGYMNCISKQSSHPSFSGSGFKSCIQPFWKNTGRGNWLGGCRLHSWIPSMILCSSSSWCSTFNDRVKVRDLVSDLRYQLDSYYQIYFHVSIYNTRSNRFHDSQGQVIMFGKWMTWALSMRSCTSSSPLEQASSWFRTTQSPSKSQAKEFQIKSYTKWRNRFFSCCLHAVH